MTSRELRILARRILTARQFEAWDLSRFHGRSYQTIAYMLDIDKSTARGLIRRGDQKLDRWLRHNCESGDVSAPTVQPNPTRDSAGEGAEGCSGGQRCAAA